MFPWRSPRSAQRRVYLSRPKGLNETASALLCLQAMYACVHETEADFSRGCVLPVIACCFLATHPPTPTQSLTSSGSFLRAL